MSARSARKWIGQNNHKVQGFIWMGLGIPTVLWWKDSILWVALMSIYANVESSFSAHESRDTDNDGKEER